MGLLCNNAKLLARANGWVREVLGRAMREVLGVVVLRMPHCGRRACCVNVNEVMLVVVFTRKEKHKVVV